MSLSPKAQEIHAQINREDTKLGELRKIAKEIKKDHELALELWASGDYFPRQLAILIMDKKLLTPGFIDGLMEDIQSHDFDQRVHLTDWLMANQLTKGKKIVALIESWEKSPSILQRRIFWYYQGRKRWMGNVLPGDDSDALLKAIEEKMSREEPEVQWAMNFAAAQIGIFDGDRRDQCLAIGEKIGLYKDDPVPPNCTPAYLPEWIRVEVEKHKK